MQKRNIIFLLVFIALLILVSVFSEELRNLFQQARTLEKEERGVYNDWISIGANSIAIITTIAFLIRFLFTKNDSTIQPAISTPNHPTPKSTDELLQEYYQQLHSSCEVIDLSLVDVKFSKYARSVGNKLTLPVIYQEMDAEPCRFNAEEEGSDQKELKENQRKPLMDWVADDKYQRVIILGDPGSGKTMFMDMLAWKISGSHLGEKCQSEFNRLPIIRIRLRAVALLYQEKGFGKDFLRLAMQDEIETMLGDNANGTWVALEQQLLKHGVILLDGLDEVPEQDGMRTDMLDAIDELAAELGTQARLIITSRPYVFEKEEQAQWLEGFSCLMIQDMQNWQIERFIENWYRLLKSHKGRSEAEAQKVAHKLFIELENRAYLLDPARRPLILTLLTSLHYAREVLPHSRAELYEDAIDLMLERWTQRIHTDSDYPLESFEKKILEQHESTRKIALQRLAYEAHSAKQLQIPAEKIKGLFADFLTDDCNSNNLLDFMRYRSGILKPSKGDAFEFYHRSFQAYLAALQLTESSHWQLEIERLLKEEGKDWWGEVYLLLVSAKIAGNSKPDAISLLLRSVPETIDYENFSEQEWQLFTLAAQATVEQQQPLQHYTDKDYVKLRNFLTKHLLAIVETGHHLPITLRAKAGRLLGRLGDPRKGVTVENNLPDIAWESIPAGSFMMGTEGEEGSDDEKPAHKRELKAFEVSRYPITNAQYACFIKAGGYSNESYWQNPPAALAWLKGAKADLSLMDDNPDIKKSYEDWLGTERTRLQPWFWEQKKWNNPNHPVVGISWYEALAFCNWLNTADGYKDKNISLPSEDQWEYAARGAQNLSYAWGDEAESLGNTSLGNTRDTELGRTSAVGLFVKGKAFDDASCAVYDMTGNVWEWTQSQWGKQINKPDFTYDKWVEQELERNNLEEHALRIIRGGSWYYTSGYARCAFRFRYHPYSRDYYTGFRVVRE